MKILVNGNLGYLGPIVARHLRQVFPGAELVGFDSGYFAGCLVDPERFPDIAYDTQHFGDVRRLPEEVLRDVDAVVQLAALSNDPMGKAFEDVTAEINAAAVAETARRAKAADVKAFVLASSCSVYGAGGDDAKTERSPLDPLTAYARSKIAAEEALAPLAGPEFKVTSLRFATACGFSPRLRLDLVLNDFVASAVAVGKIQILSDGTPWRPLIHVRDMARAIEWAIVREAADSSDFLVLNIGSDGWNYRIRDLAEGVRQHLGNVEVSVNPEASPDRRSYRVDFGLFARLAPRHQPQETLASAVRDLHDGLSACGFADPDFRQSRFIRLKVLSDLRQSGRLDDALYWRDGHYGTSNDQALVSPDSKPSVKSPPVV